MKPIKILAIQFKYMGDAVILTPALKALKEQIPNIELHVLVASEIAPLLENIPSLTKVWAMPRVRGKSKLATSLPIIKALRKEKFDRCVDFGGNDRGAFLSFLCGAKVRLGPVENRKLKWIQKICYTKTVFIENTDVPHFDMHFKLLSAWEIQRPLSLKIEITCNTDFAEAAAKFISPDTILCHIATSQLKKDWPIAHWARLNELTLQVGIKLVFSSGTSPREQNLLKALQEQYPNCKVMPPINNLNVFLNVLKLAKIVIAGDTGPLHFAAGLGIPILGIFAVGNSLTQAAPMYSEEQVIKVAECACYSDFSSLDYCKQTISCMASIQPETVFLKLQNLLSRNNF